MVEQNIPERVKYYPKSFCVLFSISKLIILTLMVVIWLPVVLTDWEYSDKFIYGLFIGFGGDFLLIFPLCCCDGNLYEYFCNLFCDYLFPVPKKRSHNSYSNVSNISNVSSSNDSSIPIAHAIEETQETVSVKP